MNSVSIRFLVSLLLLYICATNIYGDEITQCRVGPLMAD